MILDSMRGLMWESKHRGTLDDWDANPALVKEMSRASIQAVRAFDRDETIVDKVRRDDSWPKGVGLGTYKWKYDPAVIERAIELRCPIIDTAEGYGFGRVETELGKVFARIDKGSTWICSKVARNHVGKRVTIAAARRSRDRLHVESIDLYLIHWPVVAKLPETVEAMAELVEAGVIRHWGVSNFSAGLLLLAMRLAAERGTQCEALQCRLSPVDRSATAYLLPFARRLGLHVTAYSPLSQNAYGHAGAAEAIGWVMSQGVDCAIPATNSVGHVTNNMLHNTNKKSRRS